MPGFSHSAQSVALQVLVGPRYIKTILTRCKHKTINSKNIRKNLTTAQFR